MTIKIQPSQYKDQEAITIESDQIAAQFLPAIGAKMSSLFYKPLDYELMVQRLWDKYKLQPFDGDYVAGECSGFDDMFPTISECFYEKYPWKGTKMADHGEVWSIPWEYDIEDDRIHLSTYGVRFPYRLEKWISFPQEFILRIDYKLTNLSIFDFDFNWTAHTMINIEEGTELVLPQDVKSIVSTLSFSGALGTYGDEFPWPAFTLPDGTERDLRKLRPKSTKDAEKYFIKGKMPEGWCGLKYHESGFSLALSFPIETVPYLGVLPNEGGWEDLYMIFLEPGTASFDRVDVATLRGEIATVKAKSTYEWHLNFTLFHGTELKRVSENGHIES